MREIKFRAWDKKSKIMRFVDNIYLSCVSVISGENKHGSFEPDSVEVLFGKKDSDGYESKTLHFPDFILMQYTGLKDKTGKEIYEGDIMKRSKEDKPTFVAVIEFRNGMFGGLTYPWNKHFIEMPRLDNCDSTDGKGYDEIIGNIYQNPDLIK